MWHTPFVSNRNIVKKYKRKAERMKDFSKWLEAWENYPPVPDWMSTLDLAVVGISVCAAILGLVIGICGVNSYESGLGKIAHISFAVGNHRNTFRISFQCIR